MTFLPYERATVEHRFCMMEITPASCRLREVAAGLVPIVGVGAIVFLECTS